MTADTITAIKRATVSDTENLEELFANTSRNRFSDFLSSFRSAIGTLALYEPTIEKAQSIPGHFASSGEESPDYARMEASRLGRYMSAASVHAAIEAALASTGGEHHAE